MSEAAPEQFLCHASVHMDIKRRAIAFERARTVAIIEAYTGTAAAKSFKRLICNEVIEAITGTWQEDTREVGAE